MDSEQYTLYGANKKVIVNCPMYSPVITYYQLRIIMTS